MKSDYARAVEMQDYYRRRAPTYNQSMGDDDPAVHPVRGDPPSLLIIQQMSCKC